MSLIDPETHRINGSLPEALRRLRLPHFRHNHPPVQNANDVHCQNVRPVEKLALLITDRVGTFGFFATIFTWTVLWTGYNLLASVVPALRWKSFDPFPAFVVYLLISNVIQIMLMPLIMLGQNLQGRHAEVRAELDFQVNQKAEEEVKVVLRHLEHNTELLLHIINHLKCQIPDEELKKIAADMEAVERMD